ncbi:MAG TPA: T9SS type A sorting domain-containing protein [Candidatus Kapabacteria bacterium]|jgi:uncharacterized repeat protein (TIGR01451 family)|nr:T9SS type A sorting domain-containing protein [Candidatus Kapabacteria bacterium]
MHRVSVGARRGALCALLLLSFSTLSAQVFEWTTMGDGEAWKRGADIAVSSNGRSFAVGKFAAQPTQSSSATNLLAFGGQPPMTIAGSTDAFVVMHSSSGVLEDLLQFKSIAAGDGATATGVVFENGALYITGEISGRVDFQGLVGIVDALPRSSYIAKVDVTANLSDELVVAWVALLSPATPNSGTVRATAIEIFNGFVYITGALNGNVVAMSASGSSQTATPNVLPSVPSLFIARYTAGGLAENVAAAEPIGPDASSVGTAIVAGTVLDNFGFPRTRVAATGTSRGMMKFLGLLFTGETDADNMILAIIDDGGTIAGLSGATKGPQALQGRITGRSIEMNSYGDLYVAGELGGTVQFTGSSTTLTPVARRDFYVAKFGSLTGNFQNAMHGGASITSEAYATGIALVEQGTFRRVYLTGALAGTMQLGDYSVTSMGNHDAMFASFTESVSGVFVVDWARRAGNISTATERHHQDQGTSIAVTSNGQAYVIGEFGASGSPQPDAEFFATPSLVATEQYRNIFIGHITSTALLLRGRVTFDAQQQIPIARHRVTVSVPIGNSTVTDEVMTGADGWYTAWSPNGKIYTIATDPLPHLEIDQPWPSAFYQGSTGGVGYSFLFDTTAADTAFDLRVEITPVGTEYAVPGTERCYRITYQNHGTRSAPGGTTIVLTAADALFDPSAVPAPSDPVVVSSTGAYLDNTLPRFTFKIDTPIPPLGTGELVVCFDFEQTVEPELPITSGTELLSTVTIVNRAEDPTLIGDNTASIDDDVFFPLDPNIKVSIPSGMLSLADVRNGHEIEYMIDFYNLGPNRAQTVTVIDELPHAFFDYQASDFLTVLSGSPGMPTPTIDHYPTANPPHSTATFVFTQADLLAMHEGIDGSRGFIRFKAKLLTSLSLNTVVTNQARVRFDTQHWFTTNVASNCVGPGFGVDNICLGETTEFTTALNGESFLPTGASDLQWSFGDGDRGTGDRASHRFTEADTFLVALRFRYNGVICGSAGEAGVHTIAQTVIISPLPAKPTIVREGTTLTTDSATTYQWFRDNQPIGTERDIDDLVPGVYTVRVVNAVGCAAMSDPFTVGPGGVGSDVTGDGAVSVAPNPGTGSFRLTLARAASRSLAVAVYDATGRVVRRAVIERGATSCHIDLEGAPAGAYSASVAIDGRTITRTFVLQR